MRSKRLGCQVVGISRFGFTGARSAATPGGIRVPGQDGDRRRSGRFPGVLTRASGLLSMLRGHDAQAKLRSALRVKGGVGLRLGETPAKDEER